MEYFCTILISIVCLFIWTQLLAFVKKEGFLCVLGKVYEEYCMYKPLGPVWGRKLFLPCVSETLDLTPQLSRPGEKLEHRLPQPSSGKASETVKFATGPYTNEPTRTCGWTRDGHPKRTGKPVGLVKGWEKIRAENTPSGPSRLGKEETEEIAQCLGPEYLFSIQDAKYSYKRIPEETYLRADAYLKSGNLLPCHMGESEVKVYEHLVDTQEHYYHVRPSTPQELASARKEWEEFLLHEHMSSKSVKKVEEEAERKGDHSKTGGTETGIQQDNDKHHIAAFAENVQGLRATAKDANWNVSLTQPSNDAVKGNAHYCQTQLGDRVLSDCIFSRNTETECRTQSKHPEQGYGVIESIAQPDPHARQFSSGYHKAWPYDTARYERINKYMESAEVPKIHNTQPHYGLRLYLLRCEDIYYHRRLASPRERAIATKEWGNFLQHEREIRLHQTTYEKERYARFSRYLMPGCASRDHNCMTCDLRLHLEKCDDIYYDRRSASPIERSKARKEWGIFLMQEHWNMYREQKGYSPWRSKPLQRETGSSKIILDNVLKTSVGKSATRIKIHPGSSQLCSGFAGGALPSEISTGKLKAPADKATLQNQSLYDSPDSLPLRSSLTETSLAESALQGRQHPEGLSEVCSKRNGSLVDSPPSKRRKIPRSLLESTPPRASSQQSLDAALPPKKGARQRKIPASLRNQHLGHPAIQELQSSLESSLQQCHDEDESLGTGPKRHKQIGSPPLQKRKIPRSLEESTSLSPSLPQNPDAALPPKKHPPKRGIPASLRDGFFGGSDQECKLPISSRTRQTSRLRTDRNFGETLRKDTLKTPACDL